MDRRADTENQELGQADTDLACRRPVRALPGEESSGSPLAPIPFRRELLDELFVLVTIFSANGEVLEMNQPALEFLGLPRSDVIGKSFAELTAMTLSSSSQLEARRLLQRAREGHSARGELTARLPVGRDAVLDCLFSPMRDAGGRIAQIAGTAVEVTSHKQTEAALIKLNRELRLHSGCNRLLVRAASERELLDTICRMIVDEGGYRLAWVGFARDDPTLSVTPVASAGIEDDYLRRARISWGDNQFGQGPTGRAIREQRVEICRATDADPTFAPWRERAAHQRYRSSIALPLIVERNCLGSLNIYSDRDDAFDEAEVALLRALANDLAYGIGALTARAERQEARGQVDLFRALMQHTDDMIFVVDAETGLVLDCNDAGPARLGYARRDLLQMSVQDFALTARGQSWRERSEYIKAVGTLVSEGEYRTRSGETFPVEFSLRFVEHEHRAYIIGISRDIAERRRQREQIERLARILRMQSGINSAVLRMRSRDELLQEACRLATEVGGFDRAVFSLVDADGRRALPCFRAGAALDFPEPTELAIGDGAMPDESLTSRALRTGQITVSADLTRPEPPVAMRERLVELGYRTVIALPLIVDGRREGALVLTSRDRNLATDDELLLLLGDMMSSLSFALRSRANAAAAQYLAYYDALTGLAKRARFIERLDELLRHAQPPQNRFVIIAFDVRGLNRINDTFGRHFGDQVLQRIAERLRRYARDEDHIGHMGGGTFTLVEPPLNAGDGSLWSVLDANLLAEPIEIEGRTVRLSCIYGVAHFPDDGADANTLLQRAEAALKTAKDSGEGYLHYRLEMHSEIAERLELEHRLSTAVAEEQFELFYQAQLDLETGRIESLEALLRWNDPDSGVVAPGRFLGVLESTGMILSVGDWALRRAVEDCERWYRMGVAPLRVAVNVSAVQLRQKGFVDRVLLLCERLRQCPGFGLDIELTESTLLQDLEGTVTMLRQLRAAGVRIALDDFGTGYSSLGLLSKLPVNLLKIDRSFVDGIPDDASSVALVESMLRLASEFRLITVIEGVETERQLAALRSMRCDLWQGYLHGRPVPAAQIFPLLPKR